MVREVDPRWRGAVFICHNERPAGASRPSCGAGGGVSLRAWVRDRLGERGWRREVLVSRSGCLDVCSGQGTTVALMHADGRPREVFVVRDPEDRELLLERIIAAFSLG